MKFEIDSKVVYNYFKMDVINIDYLNDNFDNSWVFVKCEDPTCDVICYLVGFDTETGLYLKYDKHIITSEYKSIVNLGEIENIDFDENYILSHMVDLLPMFNDDIIYKLNVIDEKDKIEPKIRWWKNGKFENLKTFEQFNDLDPYGEEDWDDDDICDLSELSSDEQVERLRNLINDSKVSFNSTYQFYDNGLEYIPPTQFQCYISEEGISSILCDEDGDMIFVLRNEFYKYTHFILDITKPILVGKKIIHLS